MAIANPPRGTSFGIDWERIYDEFSKELLEVEEIVSLYESDSGVTLTPGALHILILPLVEGLQEGEQIDFTEFGPTVKVLFETVASDPDSRDEDGVSRSSRSMLKAVAKNWCGIPPICRRRQR